MSMRARLSASITALSIGLGVAMPAAAECFDLLRTHIPPTEFVAAHVGKKENFSGPNCFNTTLRATGVFPPGEIRYVHHDEFEEILKAQFEPVTGSPQVGDLVLYNPAFARDHAAVWMGDGKVFHKKDVGSTYSYRVVGENEVFASDPGDVVDPFERGAQHPTETGVLKKVFYRRKISARSPETLYPEWKKYIQWIDAFSEDVIQIGNQRRIGIRWGFVMEDLTSDLMTRWRFLETSGDPAARLAWKKLESLNQQVFRSIDDAHFSSRYASARGQEITTEICWQDTVEFRYLLTGLIPLLRDSRLPPLSAQELENKANAVMNRLRSTPRYPCQIPLLSWLN